MGLHMGGLLEKQSGHGETQPKIQLSDRGQWKEWAQLYLPAPWVPEDLWGMMLLAGCSGLARERAVAFAVSICAGTPGCPVPCRACSSLSCRGHLA